jgi:hypothetical protein
MGACMSTGGMVDVSDDDKRRHREAEKYLKEVSLRQNDADLRSSFCTRRWQHDN